DESSEHLLEASSRVLGGKLGDLRLFPDDQCELGNEVGHQPTVRAVRLEQSVSPRRQVSIALRQKAPCETLRSLCEGRMWNVALRLLALARSDHVTLRYKHPL